MCKSVTHTWFCSAVGKEKVAFISNSTHTLGGVVGGQLGLLKAENILIFKTLISFKLCHLCEGLSFLNCIVGLTTVFSCLSLGSCADTIITF